MDQVRTAVEPVSRLLAVAALVAAAACGQRGDAAPVVLTHADSARLEAQRDSIVRARPGYVIDSVLPVEEELRRFRLDVPRAPKAFEGGARSREALLRLFVDGVTRYDTAALRRLAIDRAEFAYLVYPGSSFTRPPYRQSPALTWFMLTRGSDASLLKLLNREGGKPLTVAGMHCREAPQHDGQSTLWRGCHVQVVRAPGDTMQRRLFGVIVEHRGRFKFASFANDI
jgi:hypothetical protein